MGNAVTLTSSASLPDPHEAVQDGDPDRKLSFVHDVDQTCVNDFGVNQICIRDDNVIVTVSQLASRLLQSVQEVALFCLCAVCVTVQHPDPNISSPHGPDRFYESDSGNDHKRMKFYSYGLSTLGFDTMLCL